MSNIAAIGLSNFPSLAQVGQSSAILEMQLARYQAQLADWMSCPSCNTPEGKTRIQELSSKVSETKQRIDAANVQNQGSVQSVATGSRVLAAQALNVVGSSGLAALGQASATGSIGTILNVLA